MDQRNRDLVCERLGDLAVTTAPGDDRLPDARQWALIDQRLDRPWWLPARWLSRRLWPALALSVVAMVGVGGWLIARRPLAYQVRGCLQMHDGAACRAAAGAIAFTDGSHIELEPQTRIYITPLAFARGAELSLDDGDATLAVVHRERTHWTVHAGPFQIDVTGTRFSVHWSKSRQILDVGVTEGEVHVRGGSLARTAVLRAGQNLHAGLHAEIAEKPNVARPEAPGGRPAAGEGSLTTSSVDAKPSAPTGRPTTTRPQAAAARRRAEASVDSPSAGDTGARSSGTSPSSFAVAAGDGREGGTWYLPGNGASMAIPSPEPSPSAKPAATTVVFAPNGQLGGAMTGFARLARGQGTNLSIPVSDQEHVLLRPDENGLCAGGTVAGLRCVNENTPQARCNWDRNWGVAIDLNVKPEGEAWGDEAPKRLAVEFHGRSASYRLNAHRKGDSHKKNYCIEDYKSGQMVTPSMFKERCWEGEGETLPDFASVDHLNLQFPSSMQYVAFRYCISGVRVER
jgi:hypothetical protein